MTLTFVCTRNKISLSCSSTLSSFPYTDSAMSLLTCEFIPISVAFPCEIKKKKKAPLWSHSVHVALIYVILSSIKHFPTFLSGNIFISEFIPPYSLVCLLLSVCFSLCLWGHYTLFLHLDWTQPRTLSSFLYSPNETTILISWSAMCVPMSPKAVLSASLLNYAPPGPTSYFHFSFVSQSVPSLTSP